MKKIVSMIVTFCMLLGLFVLPVSAADELSVQQNIQDEIEAFDVAELPYEDVHSEDWFYDYVGAMYESELMTGLTETTFGPNETLARAQFAVIVYRFVGGDNTFGDAIAQNPDEFPNNFPDVAEGEWYTNAIKFAAAAGIVTGYTDTGLFGTGDQINREQMAVMMFRLAKFLNEMTEEGAPEAELPYDMAVSADFSSFADAASVSEYAQDAMKWVVGQAIISGKDNETRLDPQGAATRAECATIFTRFIVGGNWES